MVFVSFSWLMIFLEKNLLYDTLVPTLNNSFLLHLLQVWYLYVYSHFSWFFSKTALFISLKKSFFAFFLSSVLISMYVFNHASWLNKITLCTFCNTNPWFDACCKFYFWITYSFSSFNLTTSFWTYLIFTLSSKKGK